MSRQEIVRKPSTTDTANTEVPVQDHGSIQDILSSSTHSVQSVFVHVIASDRYGFCIYECEISPEDTCSAALAKVRNVVLAAQNSIWDKLRRLLAHLLFTNIIGIAEFEQVHEHVILHERCNNMTHTDLNIRLMALSTTRRVLITRYVLSYVRAIPMRTFS